MLRTISLGNVTYYGMKVRLLVECASVCDVVLWRHPTHGLYTAETVARVKAYILADPDILHDKTKFVEGWGWDHTKWLLEEWPTYVRALFSLTTKRSC